MKSKVIIDLDGVIFKPVGNNFAKAARAEYGNVVGTGVALAYKYCIGGKMFGEKIAKVLYDCACATKPRPGTIAALDEIVKLPDVTVEFCSKIAFPQYARRLERHYRTVAPCMDAVAHYELISPFESKRNYLYKSTGMDNETLNYVLDSQAHDIRWPTRWRTTQVMVYASARDVAAARMVSVPRVFNTLSEFKDFLAYKTQER